MALALYRKYRPRTFGEVIGQEQVTEPLMQALRSGRLHHAYLFSGPRGCGKTSSARILARSLNCAKGPTPDPCGECDSCVALAPDGPGSIDVIEIDAASHGGVDDARELREKAFFAPVASRFKVYVIDEAHMVTTQGFNALLKLVEEPPEFVVFVFATTEPEKVLGTIRSRTHHYPFRLIPPGVLRPYLEKLCLSEGVHVEPAVFPLVVRAGGGSARDSLSVLDQLIAGAGPNGVSYSRAVALLGVTDVALIDEMVDALAAADGAAAFETVDRVAEAGHDARRFATDLLERLRDLIVLQRVPDAGSSGLIDGPADQLERMAAQATRMGPATSSRLADIIHNGLTEMRGATAPRLLLELIVARMLLPGADDSHGALLQRLERMERRLGAADPEGMVAAPEAPAPRSAGRLAPPETGPAVRPAPPEPAARPAPPEPAARSAPAATPSEPARTSPAPEPPASSTVEVAAPAAPEPAAPTEVSAPGVLDAAAIRRVWDEVLTTVRRRSPRAAAVIREASVRDVQGDEVVLLFQHKVHADMLPGQADLLAEALHEVVGGAWRMRAEIGGDERARPTPAPSARAGNAGAPVRPAPSGPRDAGSSGGSTGADDWPETAQPGGSPSASSGEGAAPSAAARPAARPARSTPQKSTTKAPVGNARGAGTGAAQARAAGNARSGARGRDDVPPPDEPPFDPDYDRPPFDGFDPGDEPLDDAKPGVRESSEEQALRAVTEHFSIERIGDTGPRA